MKYTFSAIISVMVLALAVSSCLSDNTTEITYYDDAAITSVTLGTLTQVKDTVSSTGADSTYTTTYTGSKYPMYIDQANHLIYNPDSLPYGTKTKMLITISTKNSGYCGIKSLTSDTISTYSSSDTIDVSEPRTVVVQSIDLSSIVRYKMSVNIHQENGDIFYWNNLGNFPHLTLGNMRALDFQNNIYVYGTKNGKTEFYSANHEGYFGNATPIHTFNGEVTVASTKDMMYILNASSITTFDGSTWKASAYNAGKVTKIFAANEEELYGLSANDSIMKLDLEDGTWSRDIMDDETTYIPRYDVTGMCFSKKTNSDAVKMLLFGNREETTATSSLTTDSLGRIWTRDYVMGEVTDLQPWFKLDNYTNANIIKRLEHLSVIKYGTRLIVTGGRGGEMAGMKTSLDEGINWYNEEEFILPDDLDTSTSSFGFASDSDGYIWFITSKGTVYKGCLKNMTWK